MENKQRKRKVLMKPQIDDNKNKLILAYNKLKKELDNQLHSETLKKYKILSKAYKLGKKIYGRHRFSIFKLSCDYEIPHSTCKRILSLLHANKNTWAKIKSGKISSFKASMILLKKDTTYQDEMTDLVIQNNLSTYQIRELKVKKLSDVNKQRLKFAVEKGFARSDTAYRAWIQTLERIEHLVDISPDELPKSKLPELKTKLQEVKKDIEEYERRI